MSFLSSKALKEILPTIVVDPNQPVDCVAIVLRIGHEAFVTGNTTKVSLRRKEQIEIPSGQFALLITEETISLPLNKMGFIGIKFSLKKKGLVNVSGFHVDPGFKGKLLFSVYNAGASDIVLSRGADAFRLWIANLDGDAEQYNGKHQGLSEISDDDVMQIKGRIASPAALEKRIDRLYFYAQVAATILTVLLVPLFVEYWWPAVKSLLGADQSAMTTAFAPGKMIAQQYSEIDGIGSCSGYDRDNPESSAQTTFSCDSSNVFIERAVTQQSTNRPKEMMRTHSIKNNEGAK